MPIYKITTEGDCEGRSVKQLGYYEANSAEHAVKYLKSIGKNEYYYYNVEEINNLVTKIDVTESSLSHFKAERSRNWSNGTTRWTVVTNKELMEQRKHEVQSKLAATGLSKAEILAFLKEEK